MKSPADRHVIDDGDALIPDQWDIICLSHLRWDFVFQRPQQLMTRFARDRRVFFVEEPVFDAVENGEQMEIRAVAPKIRVAVPHLYPGSQARTAAVQRALLDDLISSNDIRKFVLWYWTSMSVVYTHHLAPEAVIFDCMDELSGFANAPPELSQLEDLLLGSADVVFTGGHSLYEAKAPRHSNIHPFPSSVDIGHFGRARLGAHEPADQASLRRPRLGFFGVVDERMDLELVEGVARQRPDWEWVIIGPIAKIDPQSLPRAANIHYLGMKPYAVLPDYLAGWDVAVLPFARNAATRFISPTKTPEYLAAGCAVVSTSIRDVIRPYGDLGLVHIADSVEGFVAAVQAALREDRTARLARVDRLLADASWDAVVRDMDALITTAIRRHRHSEALQASVTPGCSESP